MSEDAKHTPGPWDIEDDLNGFVIVGPRKGCIRHGEHDKWALAHIGDSVFWDDPKFRKEDEANARLIAAAPAMLNALKAAVAPLAATADQFPRGKERLQLVEAALALAEGR